jgi:hypothetical protein
MADSSTVPSGGRSREEIAMIEVGQTTISAPIARGLVAFFLLATGAVLVLELVAAGGRATGVTAWSKLTGIPAAISAALQIEAATSQPTFWRRTLAANRAALAGISGFEQRLEDESVIGQTLRPPAQAVLSSWLGAGNERVYVGRDGWLFYRPDVEYLTGHGFLENRTLRRRVATSDARTSPPQPDPRPALSAFHQQLAAQGIALIVIPTPVKPGIHPEKLTGRTADGRAKVQNASYAQLITWLQDQSILVFDPEPVLEQVRQSAPQYLATDTHWRPEAMELIAERLAAFVNQHVTLPAAPALGLTIVEQEITNSGDTAVMLDLPAGQQLYPPERAVISRVLNQDGSPWRSDRGADVLVLGDSFANIYSLASMGWGDSAGLVEHLSYALGRPADRIVQNDDGAFATRELLQRAGPERLAGKRVVIWQFAARELAAGNWKVIE